MSKNQSANFNVVKKRLRNNAYVGLTMHDMKNPKNPSRNVSALGLVTVDGDQCVLTIAEEGGDIYLMKAGVNGAMLVSEYRKGVFFVN